MLFSAVSVLALASVGGALAAPLAPRADDIDTTILQYALTLEHLENAFYSEALSKFNEAAFVSAGFPSWVRKRIVQIGQHEAQHVQFLQGALGSSATKPCEYKFPYTDVAGFLGLSSAIEGVGVTAYLGAANKITNPAYLTAAASILTTEARHQTWVSAAALKGQPWSGPEDTPLGFSEVYTIAAGFITSCPSSNPALPVTAFPAATIDTTNFAAGDQITLSYNSTAGATENLIIYSGLTSSVIQISDKKATIPSGLQGTAYGIISTASTADEVVDSNVVAGPIIISLPVSSSAVNS